MGRRHIVKRHIGRSGRPHGHRVVARHDRHRHLVADAPQRLVKRPPISAPGHPSAYQAVRRRESGLAHAQSEHLRHLRADQQQQTPSALEQPVDPHRLRAVLEALLAQRPEFAPQRIARRRRQHPSLRPHRHHRGPHRPVPPRRRRPIGRVLRTRSRQHRRQQPGCQRNAHRRRGPAPSSSAAAGSTVRHGTALGATGDGDGVGGGHRAVGGGDGDHVLALGERDLETLGVGVGVGARHSDGHSVGCAGRHRGGGH